MAVPLPVVVIAGRPNVGKSTLFNRLAGRRYALVADVAGVTRDHKEKEIEIFGRPVRLMDTAGLEESAPETLYGRMRSSSESALSKADLVLFCVDVKAGITPVDRHFAIWLRKMGKPVLLVANKAEGRSGAAEAMESFSLGLGEPVAVSAEHGEGITDLMQEILAHLPPEADMAAEEEDQDKPLKLAIVGRPNAGKSTLLNQLLGQERMLTGPEPGLTRDSVAVFLYDGTGLVELVDTAGLRKKARIEDALEKMSTSATIESLKMAEVVALVIDATLGLEEQDLQIARLIEREGRCCVLVLNKWDAIEDREGVRKKILNRAEISLTQMRGLPMIAFSALTGAGVKKFLPAVRKAYEIWNKRIPTGELNRWFDEMLAQHTPPLIEGKRLKLRYITQVKARPPTFVVFGTRAEQLPEDYKRYLVNGLRHSFHMPGTPIRLQVRGTKNPYVN
ncbi:ribosome biogenesis GTPase Der [Entomobacter blattae]|uniref:GTPase Der n=1 Tax=Entomobacter blattae TaxID=2762277 RepID=A0A7H1NSS2_9PROT|nr:ribosome biogenesis GTPase Der [Entomobacter blattae]QNT78832.1 GTPase Der [Entomobacter blattae]